jgi:eukaryotic-like serine/threonine-protein kinase
MDLNWIDSQFPQLSKIEKLGVGGQKVVFKARHHENGDVVLKLILQKEQEERTEREILACEQIASDHVPSVFEYGKLDSELGTYLWLIEKRILGETLRFHLNKGPLKLSKILNLFKQILSVLICAEQKHIVHRDIKPENLMLDDKDKFWLLDFGISRHLDLASLTASMNHWGVFTPGYAAPEQMNNKKTEIDSRTDMFALGIVVFECIHGYNPFIKGARDQLEIINRVEKMPLPILDIENDSEDILRDLLSVMTNKYPNQRPKNMSEVRIWFLEAEENILINNC